MGIKWYHEGRSGLDPVYGDIISHVRHHRTLDTFDLTLSSFINHEIDPKTDYITRQQARKQSKSTRIPKKVTAKYLPGRGKRIKPDFSLVLTAFDKE